jgi:bifunctional DNA-binding transcriptional regulator/antitoxin component of YhaV-PrlF toxin-antitoxin module
MTQYKDGNSYMIPVEADTDGELMITFPDDLMETMGWKPGDVVEWVDNKDETWTLRKLT